MSEKIPLDMRDMLTPISKEEYFLKYFDQQYLHIPGAADKFSQLPGSEDIDKCIRMGTPWALKRMPEVFIDGLKVPVSDIHHSFKNMDDLNCLRPDNARYKKLFDYGATIALYGVHSIFPSLNDICHQLSQETNAETEAHVLYSQQECQGLGPHYDCVDIFVLQISGHKRWFLSSQRAKNPIKGYGVAEEYDDKAPSHVIDMRQGDLLYIPRGTFHHAVAQSSQSLHATIALRYATTIDMLELLLEEAAQLPEFREYLRFGVAERSGHIGELLKAVTSLGASDNFIKLLDYQVRNRAQIQGPAVPDSDR